MRLIDADDALKLKDEKMNWVYDLTDLEEFLTDVPTVDAEPVRHGKCENIQENELYVPDEHITITITTETCSVCHRRIGFIGPKLYIEDNYCPKCGAKLDAESDDS